MISVPKTLHASRVDRHGESGQWGGQWSGRNGPKVRTKIRWRRRARCRGDGDAEVGEGGREGEDSCKNTVMHSRDEGGRASDTELPVGAGHRREFGDSEGRLLEAAAARMVRPGHDSSPGVKSLREGCKVGYQLVCSTRRNKNNTWFHSLSREHGGRLVTDEVNIANISEVRDYCEKVASERIKVKLLVHCVGFQGRQAAAAE
eukprot:760632-Hanusia_phi.AAC.2